MPCFGDTGVDWSLPVQAAIGTLKRTRVPVLVAGSQICPPWASTIARATALLRWERLGLAARVHQEKQLFAKPDGPITLTRVTLAS